MDRHVAHLRHIILILTQPVFALSPSCCMLSGDTRNTNFIFFGLTGLGLETRLYHISDEHVNHYTTDAVNYIWQEFFLQGPRWQLDQLTIHTSLSPIWHGFTPAFVNYKKGCTRFAAASDNVYQLLAHGRWFSSGTPASSTTKTGRHDIAEILLKVALNTIKQSINQLKIYRYDNNLQFFRSTILIKGGKSGQL